MTWIAVDWGTTRLRAWRMDPVPVPLPLGGEALAPRPAPPEGRESADGMGRLSPGAFGPALARLLAGWLDGPVDVLICGMAGSREGWTEAPYLPVPARLDDLAGRLARPADAPGGARVAIVPGLSQADPPDVMRGEETQILGLLAQRPGFAGTVCLPGTHSKWAEVAGGRVQRFGTHLTGELFDLLAERSILRHAVAGEVDLAGFDAGLDAALADPAGVAGRLFGLRAARLLEGADPGWLRGRLSGLLLGQEIAGGAGPVTLIGAGALTALYARGLGRQGRAVDMFDGAALARAGLARIREGL